MFSKRRRAASNPPQRPPPSASASLAATKAFITNRESHGDLSSAAAAAALRTHVTTPTPVGDTVTKRMVRRGSASSNGSNVRQAPGPLRRQSSSGSMTERSFRAASPGRGSPSDSDAPPVPPVPQDIYTGSASHRRASSLEPVYRGQSPGPRSGGRGVSLDRGSGTAGRGQQRQAPQLAQVSEEEEAVRNLVNFSRPMSPGIPANKQNPSPPTSHGWFGGPVVNQQAVQRMASTSRPQTSSGVSAYDLQNARRTVQNAAERPVKTHQIAQGVEGYRLASGSMRGKPSGTVVQSRSFLPATTKQPSGPVDPNSPDAVYDPSTRTFIRKQDAMAIHRELHQEPEQPTRQYVAQHVGSYQPSPVAQKRSAYRSPSPVRQRVESPTPQRAQELPRMDTTPRSSEPVHRQTAPQTPERPIDPVVSRRDPEDHVQATVQPSQHTAQTDLDRNQDSSYPRIATPVNTAPSNTVPEQGRGSIRTTHDRHASLSPPRNAHFASVAVELTGAKHEPLPRSISPAKSALKSSPSVSRRSHSPIASNGRLISKGASSEASVTSDEGTGKKKRNVRVSFDERPIVASTAARAEPASPVDPPSSSGLGVSKWSPIAEKDNEFEDFMKPRAALPVFGSIRDKERRPTDDGVAEKVTETVTTTPMSASTGSIGEHTHASNDHALGNIVAGDFAKKSGATNDPLPPQVTTVEGSGYVSDSSNESGVQKHGEAADSWQSSSTPEPKSLTSGLDEKTAPQVIDVPQLAFQPATPSPRERSEPVFQSMTIPGDWDENVKKADASMTSRTEPGASSTPVATTSRQQGQTITFAEEEDLTDDNSSVYSDAYEDLEDTDGGFASIDALMTSPVASSSSGLMSSMYAHASAPESPTTKRRGNAADDGSDSDVTTTQDWNAAQQHWSELNASRKSPQREETEADRGLHTKNVSEGPATGRAITSTAVAEPIPQTASPAQTPQSSKPLKSALKKPTSPQSAPAPVSQLRQSMRGSITRDNPESETHLKKTMRGGTATAASRAEPTMRASLRNGSGGISQAQPQLRASMRASDASPSAGMGLAASRHSALPSESKSPRGALQKRHIPAAASKARPQSTPAASRPAAVAPPVPTYDSDSDASASSFQRSRARRSQGGQFTMRGSMRQEPTPTMRGSAPAPTLKQVRSISPPRSPAPAIRKSMRPSSPTPEAVKSSRFSIRSLSPMGRFRKAPDERPASPSQPKPLPAFSNQSKPAKQQSKPVKQKAPIAEKAKAFRSRFADSSDEDDDDQPRRFQSRFADSDDEPADYKLPPGLAPVRGIPKRRGEEDSDSTDLEEEEDEIPKSPSAPAGTGESSNGATTNGNAQGAALATGSLRDSKYAPSVGAESRPKTKRGFFGLGKKKKSIVGRPSTADLTAKPGDIPMPPSQRTRETGLPLTPIDEDKDFTTSAGASPQRLTSPKLQRRSTPEWPLPPPPLLGDNDRPMSSDGIVPRRPRFQNRQASQISNVTAPVVDAQGRSVSYGRTGKKKKFQGLRRAFGLHD